MGRVFVFLVGLVIAGLGWAIYDPSILANLGPAAAYAPSPIPLGPLEIYRPITAGAVGVLGVLLLLGAIAGHRSSRAYRSKSARPHVLVFEDPTPVRPTPAAAEPEPVADGRA